MLLPVGHEGDKVRRIPWVTFSIIAICAVMYLLTTGKVEKTEIACGDIEYQVYNYYKEHPYLQLDEETKKTFEHYDRQYENIEKITSNLFVDKYALPASEEEEEEEPEEEQIKEEQAQLDTLIKDLQVARDARPYYKWGLVPIRKTFISYITHMFMHAGFLHLVMNMFFLYIMGPFLEDVWGRVTYAVFYLVCGMLAAQVFCMHYPGSPIPMVGASAAIYGVMGGFVIRHWNVKIRYFYMISIFIRGFFNAPAWVMLPLGALMEFINARIMDAVFPGGSGGVAHWAHVWGFVFGILGALAIKYFKIEQKFVAPKIAALTTFVNKSFQAYEEAIQCLTAGDRDKAYGMLMANLKNDPTHQESIETLWTLASEMASAHEVAPYLSRLIEKEVQQGKLDLALFHFRHLRSKFPDSRFSTQTKIKILDQVAGENEPGEAKDLFNEIIQEVNVSSPPGFLLDLCSAAVKFDLNFGLALAPKAVDLALRHPEIPGAKKDSLKQTLAQIPQQRKSGLIKADSYYGPEDTAGTAGAGLTAAAGAVALSSSLAAGAGKTIRVPGPDPFIPVKPVVHEYEIVTSTKEWASPTETQGAGITFTPSTAQPPPVPKQTQPPPVPKPAQPPPIPKPAQKIPTSPPASPSPPPPPSPRPVQTPSMPPRPSPTPQPPPQSRQAPQALRNLRVTNAVPLGVKESKIALNIENMGERIFGLEKIMAMAVVKITPQGDRPFLLIDLLLDDLRGPTAQPGVIRTIRLVSTAFNPQKIVPQAPNPLEAFKFFTSGLLKLSGAKPYPDQDAVQLKKFYTFPSINEYEKLVLKASPV